MRVPEKRYIEYCGYKEPGTPGELKFEISGLETAIKEAEKRISILKQSALFVQLSIEEQEREGSNDNNNSR